MDHDEAVRQKATERYLLDELDPELRDQFEEHLFDCQDCALDLRAAATFVEQSKAILAKAAVHPQLKEPVRAVDKTRWLAWLRPALAVPLLALLLAVVAYQNFVTYPKLMRAASEPQMGPWASVNVSTRGAETAVLKTHPGEGFALLVNFPPQDEFASYVVDLYNPAGKLEWSGPISAAAAGENRQVYVPGRDRLPGTYTLVVDGIRPTGESKEISRHPIDWQIQSPSQAHGAQ